MCKQCAKNFFRDFDGQCQQCPLSTEGEYVTYSDGTYNTFKMIFNVIILIVFVKIVKDMAVAGQEQNKLSTGVYLFKNIVNFVIYLVLLSQVFEDSWMREGWEANSLMKGFVDVIRVFYKVPNKAVDS